LGSPPQGILVGLPMTRRSHTWMPRTTACITGGWPVKEQRTTKARGVLKEQRARPLQVVCANAEPLLLLAAMTRPGETIFQAGRQARRGGGENERTRQTSRNCNGCRRPWWASAIPRAAWNGKLLCVSVGPPLAEGQLLRTRRHTSLFSVSHRRSASRPFPLSSLLSLPGSLSPDPPCLSVTPISCLSCLPSRVLRVSLLFASISPACLYAKSTLRNPQAASCGGRAAVGARSVYIAGGQRLASPLVGKCHGRWQLTCRGTGWSEKGTERT